MKILDKDIIDLYCNENGTLKEISNKFNLKIPEVKEILFRNNIKLKSKTEINKINSNKRKSAYQIKIESMSKEEVEEYNKSIVKMYCDGYSMRRVYETFKVPEYIVKILLTRNNIEIRDPSKSQNLETVKEIRKKTCNETYGNDYPNQSKTVRNKYKNTVIDKYGVSHYSKTNEFKKKFERTCIRKFGVKCDFQSEIIKNKIRKTNIEKYGVPYTCALKQCIESSGKIISKINKRFQELLTKNKIDSEFEFHIDNSSYDLHILNSNILIEIDPTYTHNSTVGVCFNKHRKNPLDKDYHFNKTKLAEENGYRCIHVFDWDDWNDILDLIKFLINDSFSLENLKYAEIKNDEIIVDRSKISLLDNKYKLLRIISPEGHKVMLRKQEVEVYDCGKLILERRNKDGKKI